MADSLLERRIQELRNGEQSIPLAFDELRSEARERLERPAFDFADGVTGDTMDANRAAFRRHRIVPRVLRDVADRDLSVELFGREIAGPIVLAPVGKQRRLNPEGEIATARAADRLGVPLTLSRGASHSIEAVAEANGDGMRLFQLYWPRNWDVARSLVERAEKAGYRALVLTLDSQIPKWRRWVLKHADNSGPTVPRGVLESDPVVQQLAEEQETSAEAYARNHPSLRSDAGLTWEAIDQLREWTDLPIVLKGILSPDDARRAADRGVDGIVASNHGARQLDGAVAALDQLAAIVEAVGDDVEVWVDSGVRTGADVFKALALGADSVLFGRPYVFGLAVAGERGVYEAVLNCLAEFESVMGLSGCASVDHIDSSFLTTG